MPRLLATAILASSALLAPLGAAESFEPPDTVPIPAGTFMQGDLTAGKEAAWHIDAAADGAGDGGGSWRSGRIGKDQAVDLTWTGETGSQVSFWLRTDTDGSEFSLGSSNVLEFLVDDAVVAAWTGSTAWTQYTHDLAAGEHTLTWRFRKGRQFRTTNDSVWVDALTVDGGAPLSAASLQASSVISTGIGVSAELPTRQVTLTRSYHMSTYEIRAAQYVAMLNWALDPDGDGDQSDALIEVNERGQASTPGRFPVKQTVSDAQTKWEDGRFVVDGVPDNHPLAYCNWYMAMFYCYALNHRLGIDNPIDIKKWRADTTMAGWRLPTEAEWERAGRGGGESIYAWGNDFDGTEGNYDGYRTGSEVPTVPVDAFAPNAYGLYNMSGNVREWCLDQYLNHGAYGEGEAVTDPVLYDGDGRVWRGGGHDEEIFDQRIARRGGWAEHYEFVHVGFRPVLLGSEEVDSERRVQITVDPLPAGAVIEHQSSPFLEGSEVSGGRLFAPLDWLLPNRFGFTRSVNQ